MNFFPIIISSGMLSLMSFVIDCAVFTSFLFDLLKIYISFFATIHHTGGGGYWEMYLSSKMERKAQANPRSGPSSKPSIKKTLLRWGIYQQLIYTGHISEHMIRVVEDWRCSEAKDFVNYCIYFFILPVHLD